MAVKLHRLWFTLFVYRETGASNEGEENSETAEKAAETRSHKTANAHAVDAKLG